MSRRVIAVLGAIILSFVVASPAAASISYMYWATSPPTDRVGERVSADTPTSSQRQITDGDFFDTTIWAANNLSDGDGRGLQQGIKYVWGNTENPACTTEGVSSPAMYNFVEFYDYGTYECYYESDATTATPYLEELLKNSSGYWQEYLNGSYQGHQILWSTCGGNACLLQAFAEELANASGAWQSKFSGSGNTPWQFYNGSLWSTISTYPSPVVGSYWTLNLSNFPTGLWWFTYSH